MRSIHSVVGYFVSKQEIRTRSECLGEAEVAEEVKGAVGQWCCTRRCSWQSPSVAENSRH
jgi:hypothetical protein